MHACMDREHKEALAKTIRDLSMNKQIIIATQDSELKSAADKICSDKLRTYEFTKWGINEVHMISD